jgi:DNA-directed RNA polymerase subunit H (RpoH/RPB5)
MATATKNSQLISEIYTSRNVIIKQLRNQGYITTDYEGFSISEVNIMRNNNQLDMIVEKNMDNSVTKKIYVKYSLTKTIKQSEMRDMIEDLFEIEQILTKNDTLYIVIIGTSVSKATLAEIKRIWETEGIHIIVQPLKRLQFNILEHILVPPHRILSDAEKIVILEKYNATSEQLPEISSAMDPVSPAIFIRPGEVCEIKRPSKTAIESLYYRICV